MDSIDICIISPWLLEAGTKRGGGIEEIDYQVAAKLSRRFNVTILGPFHDRYMNICEINSKFRIEQVLFPAVSLYPPITRLDLFKTYFLMPDYLFLLLKKLYYLNDKKIKLVIVHNGLPGLFCTFLSKLLGLKILYSEGNTVPWMNPYLLKQEKKSLLRIFTSFCSLICGIIICELSNGIRVQSNSIKTGMVSYGIRSEKITVIRGGVDTKTFRPIRKAFSDCNSIKIGFIGRLSEEKGVLLLTQIIKIASIELPNAKFIILGNGSYKKDLLVYPNIEHIGYVPREELNEWLSKIDIVLFFQKDIGLAEIEALASGKIIVAYNTNELSSVLQNNVHGLLVESDARSYIYAMISIIDNPALRELISLNARELAEREFDWDKIGNKWISMILSCI